MVGNHHRVKWLDGGELHYGLVVPPFSGKARILARQGKLLLDDAILPLTQWTVPETDIADVQVDEYQDYICLCHQIAVRESDALGNRIAKGKLIVRFVSKTKRVYYVITAVHDKGSRVEWRGYSGDRITHPYLGWGMMIHNSRLAAMIGEEESIRRLFDTDQGY